MISNHEALLKLAHDENAKWDRTEENSAKNRGIKIYKVNKETGKAEKGSTRAKKRSKSEKERGMYEYFLNLSYNEKCNSGVF